MEKENNQQISIDLQPEVAKGTYANLAIITHSQSEFVLDFASMLPGLPKPQVQSRIIMTPEHAKRLLMALQDNVSRYETNNGLIVVAPPAGTPPPQQGGTFHMGGFGQGNGGQRS